MKIEFTKMHALGNDFVVIDCLSGKHSGIAGLAGRLLDRRVGIGGDQLLLVEPSGCADFRMRIFNPDGSEVETCGNGVRCFYRYLLIKGITEKVSIEVETLAGIIKPSLQGEMISVDMGEAVLEGEKIPVRHRGEVYDYPLNVDGETVYIHCISMGNPHAVVFVDDVKNFPVEGLGAKIEKHNFFPNRTNVEFIRVVAPGEIEMRVWERGTGETMACGSGACASAVAYIRRERRGGFDVDKRVVVHLAGGDLEIVWNRRVIMTGPAVSVFDGEIDIC